MFSSDMPTSADYASAAASNARDEIKALTEYVEALREVIAPPDFPTFAAWKAEKERARHDAWAKANPEAAARDLEWQAMLTELNVTQQLQQAKFDNR